MTTLLEYAAEQFPGRSLERWEPGDPGDTTLTDGALVVHVVGARDGLDLLLRLRSCVRQGAVAAVHVRTPTDATVGPDDPPASPTDGAAGVPDGSLVGPTAFGLAIGAAVTVGTGSLVSGSVFAGLGGGALWLAQPLIVERWRADRSVPTPPPRPPNVTVIAAVTEDAIERRAVEQVLDGSGCEDVRVVEGDGTWRSWGPDRG